MRFGIKDESSIDHSIWNTCQEGIRQCMEESDGMFFLSLQGDKYGYRPLPKWIDTTSAIELLLKETSKEEIHKMGKYWYVLDMNQLSSRYELKNLCSSNDEQYWTEVLPTLREKLLHDLPFDPSFPKLLIDHSITEWEMLFANECGNDRCTWIRRDFDPQSLLELQKESGRLAMNYCDNIDSPEIKEKVTHLKQGMTQLFETIHPVPLMKLSVNDYLQNNTSCQEYMERWKITITNRLLSEVEDCSAKQTKWRDWMANQMEIPLEIAEEMFHHHTFAARKAASFIGREALLQNLMDRLQDESKPVSSKELSAISVALIGRSGAGKTALMAKFATRIPLAKIKIDRVPIIMRFCGTSRHSLHGRDLLQSIILQLLLAHRQKSELKEYCGKMASQSYESTVNVFWNYIKKFPVILLIDSLDQLSNQNEARSSLSFLRDLQLPPTSRIIVSSLPDEYDKTWMRWKYRYGCETLLRDCQVPIIEINQHHMDEELIRSTISSLLARRERKLSFDQWKVLISAVNAEPTMLYLNLSLEIITKWRSFEQDVIIKPTVKGLIHQIFSDLERLFGQKLVTYAFAMITYSRDGMNDVEMIDCLSLQPEVFAEVCQYWKDVRSVPAHVWLRVKLAIKHLIAEKESGCVKWYHRQLWETAQERYQEVEMTCHQILGQYFQRQSLTLNDLVIWHPESKPNLRKAKEGFFHLLEAKLFHLVFEEICSLEMVCASALANDIIQLVTSLSVLLKEARHLPDNKVVKIDHYYRWLRKDSTILRNSSPRSMVPATASAQPFVSFVRSEYEEVTKLIRETASAGVLIPWIRTLVNAQHFDDLIASFTGHTLTVQAICSNADMSVIASASDDKTVKIWDTNTGEVLYTLEGHRKPVLAIIWNPCGDTIASGGDEGTIIIWNSASGDRLQSLTGHEGAVCSLAWSFDGSRIASGSGDKSIKIWEVNSGEVLRDLKGHEQKVSTLVWSHDGRKLASGSFDTKIKIWHPETGELLQTLEEHYAALGAIAWSPDNTKLASTSCHEVPKNIFIWDLTSGTVVSKWEGHKNPSTCLAWSPDGDYIVSGSSDDTLKIWNASTGEVVVTYKGHTSFINSVLWSRDGSKILSASSDKSIKIWNAVSQENIQVQTIGHCLAWSPDGIRVATPTSDGTIGIWNAVTGEYMTALKGEVHSVISISWSEDGRKLAMGSSKKIVQVWDARTLDVLHSVEAHSEEVTFVVWSHDGTKLASSSKNKSIKIWKGVSLELIRSIEAHVQRITGIVWSSDDSKIVSGSTDEMIKIWDVATGDMLAYWKARGWVLSLTWSPSNDIVAFGTTFWEVMLWNIKENHSWKELKGHGNSIQSVSWSRNGSKIASGSTDKVIKVWKVSDGQLIHNLEAHLQKLQFVVWDLDSTKLASGALDSSIKIWENV